MRTTLKKFTQKTLNKPEPKITNDCKHERQSSSAGGWYCQDCGAMWNYKGKLVKGGKK